MPRAVWISLLASLILHLMALLVADELWYRGQEVEVFRARLLTRPKFIQPRRASVAPPSLPRVYMEYLTAVREPGEADELSLSDANPSSVDPQAIALPQVATEEPGMPKVGGPELSQVEMPSPVGEAVIDTFESEGMELLRLEDLARVDDKRAVVIPDPRSKRDLRGFVHFTSLWLDGAGSYHFNFKPVLEDLARYMRDFSHVAADVRQGPARMFLAELVRMPLGKPIGEDGLHLVVDDGWKLDVLKGGADGIVLRNLPGGRHRIELEYAGRRQRMEVELKGGRVLTVGFKLRGLGLFTLLYLSPFAEQVRIQDWDEIFPELVMEEFYFAEEVDF